MRFQHFVFVESNTTGSGRLVIERLLDAGHFVTFLARRPEIYPFLTSSPNLAVAVLDTNDVEAVAERVRGICRQRPVNVLVTFSDYYVAIVAEVAARLGRRHLHPSAALTCRNKIATRRALRAAALPTPEFWTLSSPADAARLSASLAYPCVVKSPFESSSKGVRQVEDASELLAHFATLHSWTENARGQSLSGEVLVESLLPGPEYSVETVTLAAGDTRVVGITTKHLSAPPLFVEIGHDFPSSLAGETATALVGATLAALSAVGFDFGPAHTEIRLTPSGPVVVEINPRLAGGMIPELVRHATGIDLLSAFVDLLTGRDPDLTVTREEYASIRFLIAPCVGSLRAVRGIEAARGFPTVKEVTIAKALGAAVRPAEDATDRVGYLIASGSDRQQVLDEIERARQQVRLDIAPASSLSV